MSRLWDRGGELDERIERFTVGRDRELDLKLLPWDALASFAHAEMLASIGVLAPGDLEPLRAELAAVAREARAGEITIRGEDGHSTLEERLTERLGDVGRRIHTGRSRNDQVIACLRLWGRDAVVSLAEALLALVALLVERAGEERETSLPGYSHTRQAMPSTLGFLLAAHADGLLDHLPWLETALAHLDRSPLGSASGFGVALPLDRERVRRSLGFGSLQVNALAVQNDRGRSEWLTLATAAAAGVDLSRLAADLIWLSSDEIRAVRLADEVTTGSSIMPQKRNPDVLELVRAGAARLVARQAEVATIVTGLASGYHRDLQLTKEPFLAGLVAARDLFDATAVALAGLTVDRRRCRDLAVPAIGATDAVYARVARGEPFRSVYREVARNPEAAAGGDPAEAWRLRTHLGAPGAPGLGLDTLRHRLEEGRNAFAESRRRIDAVWRLLEPQDR